MDNSRGEQVKSLSRTVRINHDALRQSAEFAAKPRNAAAKAETENRRLRRIAPRIEDHAGRSKWGWAVLAAGMAVAALLAGAGAVYFTRQNLDIENFNDVIGLIRSDTRAFWCERAGVTTPIADVTGGYFCPIRMPRYQIEERAQQHDQLSELKN